VISVFTHDRRTARINAFLHGSDTVALAIAHEMSSFGRTVTRVVNVVIATFYFAQHAVRGRKGQPVVLMYHSVKRHERERFARQMDELLAAGTAISACEVARTNGRRRRIAVTFDDGYHSVFENALDILHERRIPATIFVPTDYLGRSPGWISNPAHRDAHERVLNPDELRLLEAFGCQVGSHGVSHRPLSALTSSQALGELSGSRRALEAILGKQVKLFALPYGDGGSAVLQLAGSAGYELVFLSVPGGAKGPRCELIGRVDVSPMDWNLEYRLKIRGAYQWLPWAIAAKAAIRKIGAAVLMTRAPRPN
jgi:peptidoglycan/xylan/chitin deacetylase (PgdA/CDA1 family)